MIKRMILMIVALALVGGAFASYKIHKIHEGMAAMMASFTPPSISTVKAEMQDWQPQIAAVGTLRAVNGADLSSEVAGIVDTISFESGGDVEQGAVLVQLRDADEVAQLKALQATANLDQINLDRDMKQFKVQAVSQATVDSDKAALANAQAQADAQQAVIDKKTIHAPFAGHLGIRQIDIGQYLNPGTAIVTLQQLDPIYVDVMLPEEDLPRLQIGQKVTLRTDAFAGQDFTGKITAVSSKVDEATRNIAVRATFDNPDHKLLPGMFGHVAVDSGATVRYLTLPQTAIVFNTYGNIVYVIQNKTGDDGKAQQTVQQSVIATGESRGDQVAVVSGIKEGDEVVTSGQVKLRNGMAVIVRNENQPPADADPKPHEQ